MDSPSPDAFSPGAASEMALDELFGSPAAAQVQGSPPPNTPEDTMPPTISAEERLTAGFKTFTVALKRPRTPKYHLTKKADDCISSITKCREVLDNAPGLNGAKRWYSKLFAMELELIHEHVSTPISFIIQNRLVTCVAMALKTLSSISALTDLADDSDRADLELFIFNFVVAIFGLLDSDYYSDKCKDSELRGGLVASLAQKLTKRDQDGNETGDIASKIKHDVLFRRLQVEILCKLLESGMLSAKKDLIVFNVAGEQLSETTRPEEVWVKEIKALNKLETWTEIGTQAETAFESAEQSLRKEESLGLSEHAALRAFPYRNGRLTGAVETFGALRRKCRAYRSVVVGKEDLAKAVGLPVGSPERFNVGMLAKENLDYALTIFNEAPIAPLVQTDALGTVLVALGHLHRQVPLEPASLERSNHYYQLARDLVPAENTHTANWMSHLDQLAQGNAADE